MLLKNIIIHVFTLDYYKQFYLYLLKLTENIITLRTINKHAYISASTFYCNYSMQNCIFMNSYIYIK